MQYFNVKQLLPGGHIEPREYQINLFNSAKDKNTLIVLPTGLGKTVIAAMLANYIITERMEKVLFLAPTRPLIHQHFGTLKELLNLQDNEISEFTGEVDNEDRSIAWITSKLIVSTPQVALNDLRHGLYDLSRFGLIVFDEAHRTTGNYAYVNIAKSFLEVRSRLILAITASPGWNKEKLNEVINLLGIENVQIRSENDLDVKKYIGGIKVEAIRLKRSEDEIQLSAIIRKIMGNITTRLKDMKILSSARISRSELAALIQTLIQRAKGGDKNLFTIIPYITALIRLDYLSEYLETQGVEIAYDYLNQMLDSEERTIQRTISILSKFTEFSELRIRMKNLVDEHLENPKMLMTLRLCEQKIDENPDARIIVFTHFRKTSDMLSDYLKRSSRTLRPVRFVGQSSREADQGLSQKLQEDIIEKFKDGAFNVLVATSVAEEGLDIPSTDLVVFYEPVPSEIRSIQRRGRTGRTHAGEVKILLYEGTRDIAYYISSMRKEARMNKNISIINKTKDVEQENKPVTHKTETNLDDFFTDT